MHRKVPMPRLEGVLLNTGIWHCLSKSYDDGGNIHFCIFLLRILLVFGVQQQQYDVYDTYRGVFVSSRLFPRISMNVLLVVRLI